MSILTKICVVAVVVLVLIFSVVAINQATVGPKYLQMYEKQKLDNQGLQSDVSLAKFIASNAVSQYTQAQEAATAAQTASQQKIASLTTSLEAERLTNSNLQNRMDQIDAKLAGLDKTLEASETEKQYLSGKLEEQRKAVETVMQRNRELDDAYNTTVAEKESLATNNRALKEEVASLIERVRELEQKVQSVPAAGESAASPYVQSDKDIVGTITTVDGDIAAINVGSAQGVEKGLRLLIHRGSELVGRLRIDDVEAGSAAGVIIQRQMDPIVGDKVMSDVTRTSERGSR